MNTIRRRWKIAVLFLAVLVPWSIGPRSHAVDLTSPNGQLTVTVGLTSAGEPQYRVVYGGQTILSESRLGLELEGVKLTDGLRLVGSSTTASDSTWKPVYGERSQIRDHYRQARLELEDGSTPPRRLQVTFRAYDEGIAFCYTILAQPGLSEVRIVRERSEFRFAEDHAAWAVYAAQGRYSQVPLSAIKRGCERPLVVQLGPECFAALGEARLVDYARMKFSPLSGVRQALVSDLASEVHARLPLRSPWRFVMVAPSPGRLLENNDLVLNLNDPCAIADTSWIKPGKVIREVTLTTAGGKACVDFAERRNLQYVEFDAGWYGHEYSDESDATTVSVDPKRSAGPLDLQAVIDYANPKGVGIILYVNRRALERQLDQILPLYRQWGVKGVKYGFVNVGSQQWTAWLHEAVRKAADQRLMVDIHDEYRPTGYSRTYPNLMTQEGIGGDETSPTNDQTLTLLFTRFLAGPADNTICYYADRVDKNACHAFQLAKAVCLYSPWQFLYWYDRPATSPSKTGGAGNTRGMIGDDPELEFYDRVPTVWDDTRVLHGQIGQYAVIARRSGEAWFIGCMNHGQARELDIPLAMLEKGRRYTAHIYSHDPAASRTGVRIDHRSVDATTVLRAALTSQGGQAIHIEPAR